MYFLNKNVNVQIFKVEKINLIFSKHISFSFVFSCNTMILTKFFEA